MNTALNELIKTLDEQVDFRNENGSNTEMVYSLLRLTFPRFTMLRN